jgi:hypothetical protein
MKTTAAERFWKFFSGESLDLKEAGEKIVSQAAESPRVNNKLSG